MGSGEGNGWGSLRAGCGCCRLLSAVRTQRAEPFREFIAASASKRSSHTCGRVPTYRPIKSCTLLHYITESKMKDTVNFADLLLLYK